MISNIEYDFANLKEKISGLSGALLGNGASEGDAQILLRVETGLLHAAIADSIGPKIKEKAETKIKFDVGRHLTTAPEYINPKFNGGRTQESESFSEFTWLTAGHGANGKFLLGINDEDLQLSSNAAQALAMLRTGQKSRDRGDAYQNLGQRGTSSIKNPHGGGRINILRLNRIKVSKATFNAVVKNLMDKTGGLRAAFYSVAKKYATHVRVPAWLAQKFEQVAASGKASVTDTLISGGATGYIESTIRGAGVSSNPALTEKFRVAFSQRGEIIVSKYKKILAGYKYNWETGQVFRAKPVDDFSDN